MRFIHLQLCHKMQSHKINAQTHTYSDPIAYVACGTVFTQHHISALSLFCCYIQLIMLRDLHYELHFSPVACSAWLGKCCFEVFRIWLDGYTDKTTTNVAHHPTMSGVTSSGVLSRLTSLTKG